MTFDGSRMRLTPAEALRRLRKLQEAFPPRPELPAVTVVDKLDYPDVQ